MSYSLRINSDPIIICPYDRNHKIARSRIQRHLVKCEKNFPPEYKQQCPYDATHRFFEHELEAHIESCPMKFRTTDQFPSRIPETDAETESVLASIGEEWEDKASGLENSFQEPILATIQPKQYVTLSRGHAIRAKRFSNSLRAPYGYSESMMLEMSDQSVKDETESVTSDISVLAVGRGQSFPSMSRGQFFRGARGNRRGINRGRSFHF